MTINGYKLKCEYSVSEAIGSIIIRILISIVTIGLALFVYYPALVKRLLNGVEIRNL